jgi:hypothetical protein
MMELDEECKKAGITVMNEIGLDPVSIYPYPDNFEILLTNSRACKNTIIWM